MIYKGGTEPLVAKYRLRPNGKWWIVMEIRRGLQLVWAAVRSCFGRGYWIQDKPWLDNDTWKDNR